MAYTLGMSMSVTVNAWDRGFSLGLKAGSTNELIAALERGLPFQSLERLAEASGMGQAAIVHAMGIPERTVARRKTAGRFSPDESERLLRISFIFEQALELFEGDAKGAVRWLTTPKRALEGHVPLDYSRTELGAREVENLVGRLEHGVFS
ncbi:MAG: antitoxin Xre-like helix-turn-helix domain-containing protein [Bryobacteraceae bacterium]